MFFFVDSTYKSFTGALNQLAKNFACEWAKDGIRANAVAPNVIKTPMSQPVINKTTFTPFKKKI